MTKQYFEYGFVFIIELNLVYFHRPIIRHTSKISVNVLISQDFNDATK